GQFVIVRKDEKAERIPLTIADYDRTNGTITLIVQEVGKSTKEMGELKAGDAFLDFVGPLGMPSELHKFGTVVTVGGGLGIAPVYPIAKELKKMGNRMINIIGARNKDMLFWVDEMKAISDDLLIATDDGSLGEKGFVTTLLDKVIKREKVDFVMAIGPMVMMRACCEVTRGPAVPTKVSLNPVMVDGTGMCGGCRVLVDKKVKFACVDGPEFDGHLVDWQAAIARSKMFWDLEQKAHAEDNHECRLNKATGA
ncbi:MAG TPA: sulfide/dihydroorotate dehydrogenase-like FAD/NAD-binding protein, partial [Candidatus Ozemobacteraceae bacterium]|nr:sulfide/dihydroorotate dehydrogenase-like FAD/NAD-binding protein [Candidatus Ozemobacteraceae bacterium]